MSPARRSPLDAFLEAQGCVVLDGGLATALEARGHRLDTDLWSARLLIDEPDEIRAVHMDYLRAGADCITTATYQASLPGLRAAGLSEREAEEVILRSVSLAIEARDAFVSDGAAGMPDAAAPGRAAGGVADRGTAVRPTPRVAPPIVAAGVGPYGAYLADGSEYAGRYGVGAAELRAFHERRFELLADSGADLLACETIPSALEADVLLGLLDGTPGRWAWLSFTCRDGAHLSDGTPFEDAVRACDEHERVAAVGVNCTDPRHLPELIALAARTTERPIVVYPNSGERYDATSRSWSAPDGWTPEAWPDDASEWVRLGARVIGGCCRVGPDAIRAMRASLLPP